MEKDLVTMFKKLKSKITDSFCMLNSPKEYFIKLDKRSVDSVLSDYLVLLPATAVFAGIATFTYNMLRTVYYDIFLDASVNYLRVLNYAAGISVSTAFLYVFVGTIVMFIVAAILTLLFKGGFVDMIKIVMYSLVPFLVFGWVPLLGLSTVLWSTYLVALGLKTLLFETPRYQTHHKRRSS